MTGGELTLSTGIGLIVAAVLTVLVFDWFARGVAEFFGSEATRRNRGGVGRADSGPPQSQSIARAEHGEGV